MRFAEDAFTMPLKRRTVKGPKKQGKNSVFTGPAVRLAEEAFSFRRKAPKRLRGALAVAALREERQKSYVAPKRPRRPAVAAAAPLCPGCPHPSHGHLPCTGGIVVQGELRSHPCRCALPLGTPQVRGARRPAVSVACTCPPHVRSCAPGCPEAFAIEAVRLVRELADTWRKEGLASDAPGVAKFANALCTKHGVEP